MQAQKLPALQAEIFYVVTPSDSDNLKDDPANPDGDKYPLAALYYGGAAAASIEVRGPGMAAGDEVVFQNVQPGTYLPVMVEQVLAGGTTAAAGTIIALVARR